jgi:hypothetical protein
VAARIEFAIKKRVVGKRGANSTRVRRRVPAAELTRWVADRRARRVPLFVIDQTGLKTKKVIVAKYGENAVFEKGKALPETKAAPPQAAAMPKHAPRSVKARPPIVRKAAAAGK